MSVRVERIGSATLYCGDCRDVLPTLGAVDAVVTDPPYGIGKDGQNRTTGGHGGRKAYEFKGWDAERPDPALVRQLVAFAPVCVLWGGNYFADQLPPTAKWLVWDKGQRISQSDGELAYTSLPGALRICSVNRAQLAVDGAEHPTQKPVSLMLWTLAQVGYPKHVCDPFMGVGSTGVACVKLGLQFTGVERDPDYFDIACRRIEAAQRQPDLFVRQPVPDLETHRTHADLFAHEAAE